MRASDGDRRAPWGKHATPQAYRQARPVWVNLDRAFGPPASDWSAHRAYPLRGEVRGDLYEWVRTTAGWMGVVEFYLREFTEPFRQLVPGAALRERDDNWTIHGRLRR